MGILLKGGTLVFRDIVVEADILVEEGKIVKVGKSIESGYSRTIDVRGKLVLPGAVDPHVHGREPGLEHKDDFAHTSAAAALGGVTTVLDMPNTEPPVDKPQTLLEKKSLLSRKSYVDFGLYGLLYDHPGDLESWVIEMLKAGAIGFKAYMAHDVGGRPPPSFRTLYRALELSRRHGFVVAFHAENKECVELFTARVISEGKSGLKAYSEARPPLCEELSIRYLASAAKAVGGRLYLAHLSSASSLKAIPEAGEGPFEIYVEVTPVHLFFDFNGHESLGPLLKVNPPVRGLSNRMRLWSAVRRGLVKVIGSDHAPHAPQEKLTDFWSAAAGVTSVQHTLPLLLSSALEGLMPLGKVVELYSENPARIFGLYPSKGSLVPGADADIVIADPASEYIVSREELAYKYKLSPYVGRRLRVRIDKVFLRGELVVDGGRLIADEPTGRPVR